MVRDAAARRVQLQVKLRTGSAGPHPICVLQAKGSGPPPTPLLWGGPPSVAEAELSRLHERLEHGGEPPPAAPEPPPAKDGGGSRFAATTLYSAREGGARTERETRTMQRFHRDHTPFATSWGDSQQTANKSWEC